MSRNFLRWENVCEIHIKNGYNRKTSHFPQFYINVIPFLINILNSLAINKVILHIPINILEVCIESQYAYKNSCHIKDNVCYILHNTTVLFAIVLASTIR